MDLESLLRFAFDRGASDLHLQAGAPPMLRVSGRMRSIDADPMPDDVVRGFVASIAPVDAEALSAAIVAGLDFSHVIPNLCRFRCSAYSHMGNVGIVFRVVRSEIKSIDELYLPRVIHDVALARRGLTLLTGTTGSGKSTTLAAMIDLINVTHRTKIITIEDPIEYVHSNKKALISQLEIGTDTPSFDQAMRQALRQDPDVILVGEMRDIETLRIALRAADTGHQVFSTVHSANAPQTVERIIAMFPANEHALMLSQLAGSIEAIISQRLIPIRDGSRRPAVEILRGSAVTEKYILDNRIADLHEYVESGEAGMQSFDQHILKMYHEDLMSGTEAIRWASKPESLAVAMRGISRTGGTTASPQS